MTATSIAIPGLLQGHLVFVTGAGPGQRSCHRHRRCPQRRPSHRDGHLNEHGRGNRAADPFERTARRASHSTSPTPEACSRLAEQRRTRRSEPSNVSVNNAGIIIREGIDSPRAHETGAACST